MASADSFLAARKELCTLRDLLRFAVSRCNEAGLVFGHGSPSAYDEAAYLILHALGLPLDTLEPFLDARLTEAERRQVLAVLRRRVTERLPAAYLTREAWLGDFSFYVDERVIVPRSFIAELLRDGLAPWVEDPLRVSRALDLCTGSGCLAVLLAEAFPEAMVDAADISPQALEVAAINVGRYGLEQRVRLIRSDYFRALKSQRYDLIVSNPPYVDAAAMAELPAEYRHEPVLALAGGSDGLDGVRIILAGAARHLTPGGWLVVEAGRRRSEVEAAFPRLPFTWLETSGGDRHVFLLRKADLPKP